MELIKRYGFSECLAAEVREEGLLLKRKKQTKLSWTETALEMAASGEDWNEWNSIVTDGLETCPWDNPGSPERAHKAASRMHSRWNPEESHRRSEEAMKRYEIRWARLDPVQGSELGKTRPVVIVSLDALNASLSTVSVCPVTSQLHPRWRSRLAIRCAGMPAEIAVDQIRTLSKSRLGSLLDSISSVSAAALRSLIGEMYAEE